jgi:hypothetical protein
MSTPTPPPSADDGPARIFAALRSVDQFDEIEVRPIMHPLRRFSHAEGAPVALSVM